MANQQRNFRLGPAILAAGGAEPAPDTWRDGLLKALDGKRVTAFAQTSKPAQGLLLAEWPGDARLTIRVRPASAEWPEQLMPRLHRARQQLVNRGSKHTTLHIVQKGPMGPDDSALQTVLAALGTGHTWPHLHLSLQFQHLTPQLLACVGASFPGLRSLSIGSLFDGPGRMALPPPASFPDLQHLVIRNVATSSQAALWRSVSQYLPQLVTFIIEQQPDMTALDWKWPGMVFSGAVSRTLKHLSLPCVLYPRIAAQLQQHAPALETLTVQGLSDPLHDPEVHVAAVCSWRTLCIKPVKPGTPVTLGELHWLPVPVAPGKLTVDMSACSGLKHLSIHPAGRGFKSIADKLARLDIQGCKTVTIQNGPEDGPGFEPAEQPQALRDAVALLAPHVQPAACELVVQEATITPALAAELTSVAAAAQWGQLSLQHTELPAVLALPTPLPLLHTLGIEQQLTDTLLAELQQCVSAADTLCVPGVDLQAAPRAGTRMPWRAVRVQRPVDLVKEWLPSALLMGDQVSWEVDTLEVCFTRSEAGSASHYATQLNQLRITRVGAMHLEAFPEHSDPDTWPTREQQPGLLRACLTLANALPCKADSLTLYGWDATASFVELLARLPKWTGELKLVLASGCGAEPSPLAHATVPSSYGKWVVEQSSAFHLSLAERDAFLLHAPRGRTAESPLCVEVNSYSSYGHGEIEKQWRELGICEQVQIRHGWLM